MANTTQQLKTDIIILENEAPMPAHVCDTWMKGFVKLFLPKQFEQFMYSQVSLGDCGSRRPGRRLVI